MTTQPIIPAPSHPNHGAATTKLLHQNMKAAVQEMGLTNGSIGWYMLEKLLSDTASSEWDDIWSLLTSEMANTGFTSGF
jgi:hypothetical protein